MPHCKKSTNSLWLLCRRQMLSHHESFVDLVRCDTGVVDDERRTAAVYDRWGSRSSESTGDRDPNWNRRNTSRISTSSGGRPTCKSQINEQNELEGATTVSEKYFRLCHHADYFDTQPLRLTQIAFNMSLKLTDTEIEKSRSNDPNIHNNPMYGALRRDCCVEPRASQCKDEKHVSLKDWTKNYVSLVCYRLSPDTSFWKLRRCRDRLLRGHRR